MPEVDLRTTIEAAVSKEEAEPTVPSTQPVVEAATPPAGEPTAPTQPTDGATPPEGATAPAETPPTEDDPYAKPPQAWKASAKGHWTAIPPAAREEIARRENNINRVLGETAQVRHFSNQFQEMVRPFEARIRSLNVTPLTAVHELLKADHLLSTAPATTKARLMAQLVQQYGVDIKELDNALAGQPVGDPVESKVDNLLQQRLAPVQQFIQQQAAQSAAQAQLQQQAETAAAANVVHSMATNAQKYPHFMAVKDTMADLVEMAARHGVALSPDQAYSRAVAIEGKSGSSEQQAAHERAQRALAASSSVRGAPSGQPSASGAGSDLRATLEAAFSTVGGR